MATATRTSVALPEIFSDGDMVLWLRKFELCAKANDWKDTDMLKRLPTLLSGKAFAIFERLAAETKEDFKVLTKALTEAFGGDENGKHLAMMAFRSRMRKPDEYIQVFAYNLEALLRRAMPNIEKGDRETLLKQQFVEGVSIELKRQLLQRPTLSYEETVTAGQQLDLAGQISSSQSVNEVNTSGGTNQTVVESPLVTQLMESVDILTRKVSELSQSVANVNAASVRNSPAGRRGPCYQCGRMGHIANECRSTSGNGRRMNYRQRQTENYCFVCGQMGHFARECQFRFQSPINSQPRQGNDQGPTRF
jgi:hypothetical protein